MLSRSVELFLGRDDVAGVVVATDRRADLERLLTPEQRESPRLSWAGGGDCRAATVKLAAAALPANAEWVAVHDAARPLTPAAVIDRVFAAAVEVGAAVPGVAVTDTIKQFDPATNRVTQTLPRATLTAVQTPQAMRRDWLDGAFAAVSDDELAIVTDDVQLIEKAGQAVAVVVGDVANIKITRAGDLNAARQILSDLGGSPASAGVCPAAR